MEFSRGKKELRFMPAAAEALLEYLVQAYIWSLVIKRSRNGVREVNDVRRSKTKNTH